MFDELKKYKTNDHFFVMKNSSLEKVCNAPKTCNGIYLVFALKKGRIELVYIGSSGKIQNDGSIKHREGGLYDRIVNGHQFGKIPRRISWLNKIKEEDMDGLDVYWYDTFNNKTKDIPAFVEAVIIQKHYDINEKLPDWNIEF